MIINKRPTRSYFKVMDEPLLGAASTCAELTYRLQTAQLLKRPRYPIIEKINKQELVEHSSQIVSDKEIRRRYRELTKQDTQLNWRKFTPMTRVMKSCDAVPLSKQAPNVTLNVKNQHQSHHGKILNDIHSARPYTYKEDRSKSLDQQCKELMMKLDLGMQFRETRLILKNMKRRKPRDIKQVRFQNS